MISLLFTLLLWAYATTVAAAASTKTEDFAKGMFKRKLDSVEKCYSVRESCQKCYSKCASARNTFFSGSSVPPSSLISMIHDCRVQISNHRTGMEPWCVNDWTRFFATPAFQATEETCKMEATECARRMREWADRRREAGTLNQHHNDFKQAEKMGATGKAMEYLQLSKSWYDGQINKYQRLDEWWDDNILIEMEKHLKTPESNDTRFSDPVFYNLTGLKTETRRVDKYLYRNDLLSARVENKFVRQDILQKVPQYLNSITSLTNHVKSKKTQTDGYLKDIKEIAAKTYEAQVKATNFAYQTTHAGGLDGEIVLLDKELLNMFSELQTERAILSEGNRKSTLTKLRLTGAMRRLVKELTTAQRKVGCSKEDTFST